MLDISLPYSLHLAKKQRFVERLTMTKTTSMTPICRYSPNNCSSRGDLKRQCGPYLGLKLTDKTERLVWCGLNELERWS